MAGDLTFEERDRVGREMQSRGLEAIDYQVFRRREGLSVRLELDGGAVLMVGLGPSGHTWSMFLTRDRNDPRLAEQERLDRLHF